MMFNWRLWDYLLVKGDGYGYVSRFNCRYKRIYLNYWKIWSVVCWKFMQEMKYWEWRKQCKNWDEQPWKKDASRNHRIIANIKITLNDFFLFVNDLKSGSYWRHYYWNLLDGKLNILLFAKMWVDAFCVSLFEKRKITNGLVKVQRRWTA